MRGLFCNAKVDLFSKKARCFAPYCRECMSTNFHEIKLFPYRQLQATGFCQIAWKLKDDGMRNHVYDGSIPIVHNRSVPFSCELSSFIRFEFAGQKDCTEKHLIFTHLWAPFIKGWYFLLHKNNRIPLIDSHQQLSNCWCTSSKGPISINFSPTNLWVSTESNIRCKRKKSCCLKRKLKGRVGWLDLTT